MRSPILLLLLSLPILATDFTAAANFRVSALPKNAIICYTIPTSDDGNVGSWEISESPGYSPLIPDVDSTLFANSNLDNRTGSYASGRTRCFVAGAGEPGGDGVEPYAPVALNSLATSRALRPETTYFGRYTNGADTATLTFQTSTIISGDTYPHVIPSDPARPGVPAWPYVNPVNKNALYNNPSTGVGTQIYMRADFLGGGNGSGPGTQDVLFQTPVYQAVGWTNPQNIVADDGALAVTSNTNPIVVTTNVSDPDTDSVLGGLTLYVKGYVDNSCAVGAAQRVNACLTINGVSCYGATVKATLLVQSSYAGQQVPMGDAFPSPTPYIAAWLNPGQLAPLRQYLNSMTGTYSRSGNDLTMIFGGTNSFDQNWIPGSHIVLDTGGTPTETTISSVTSGTAVTVASGSGPTTSASWLGRNFGFLIWKEIATCSMSIDYVHVYKSHYDQPLINGGSGGSRQCAYRRYPQGVRITAASNTSPITYTTGAAPVPFSPGDTVKAAKIRGNTAANATGVIGTVGAHTFTIVGTTGNGAFTDDGVAYSIAPAAPTGYVCMTSTTGGGMNLNWVNPDTVPATINFLGAPYAASVDFANFPLHKDNYSLDDSDPDVIGFWESTIPYADPGKVHLYRGIYYGHASSGLFTDLGPGVGATFDFEWTDITPSPSLTTQLTTFDATCAGCNVGPIGLQDQNTLLMTGNLGDQNSRSWFGVWDIPGVQIKALGNSWSSPNSHFCGLHAGQVFYESTAFPVSWYGLNDFSQGVFHPYKGPFLMQLTDSGLNTTSLGDCATLLSGLGLSNPLGITGAHCSKFTVDSSTPKSYGIPLNETVGPALIGDILDTWSAVEVDSGETLRVIGISGNTIVAQRPLWAGGTAIAHPPGGYLWEWCSAIPNTVIGSGNTIGPGSRGTYWQSINWWEYAVDPHMLNVTDPYQQQLNAATNFVENQGGRSSHDAGRGNFFVFDDYALPVGLMDCPQLPLVNRTFSIRYGDWKSTNVQCYASNPAFDLSPGNCQGEICETHPGAGASRGPYANTHVIDVHPLQGSPGWQQTAVKVGGHTYIYKVTNYCTDFGNVCDYKRQALTAWNGQRISRDVSSPTLTIAAHDDPSYFYTYFRVYKADEYVTGSLPNDVYVNAPLVAQFPTGLGSGYGCFGYEGRFSVSDINDICVSISSAVANQIVQNAMLPTRHDSFGLGSRNIANPFTAPKTLGGSNLNTNEFPDGSHTMLSQYLIKLPSYGAQGVTPHNTFQALPVTRKTVPFGTDNVIVRFGYDPLFRATSRNERTIANAATIQPGAAVFSYETSDTYSGLPCASGCTVTIPVLAQRVLWTQWVFRNASNAIIGVSNDEPVATP